MTRSFQMQIDGESSSSAATDRTRQFGLSNSDVIGSNEIATSFFASPTSLEFLQQQNQLAAQVYNINTKSNNKLYAHTKKMMTSNEEAKLPTT